MLKREITLGNLLAIMVTLVMALITFGISISTRIEGSEVRIENSEKKIDYNTANIQKVDDDRERDNRETQLKLDKILQELGIEQGKNAKP
jgi:hypothetical protein